MITTLARAPRPDVAHCLATLGERVRPIDHRADEALPWPGTSSARSPADIYPDLVLHIEQHLSGTARGLKVFELGLDLLLEGIDRRRDGSSGVG